MHVLVVDDEPAVGQMLRSAFEMNGATVVVAASAAAALDAFKAAAEPRFDLLLVDKNLPGGMSGVDVIREVRALDEDVSIMMITAYGTPESIVQTINLGIDSYVDKPFDSITDLVTAAAAIVERKREAIRRRTDPDRKIEVMAAIAPGAPQRTDLVALFAKVRSRLIVFDSAAELADKLAGDTALVVLDADLTGEETPALMEKVSAKSPHASVVVVTSRPLEMPLLKKLVALGVVALYEWAVEGDWRSRLETVAQKLLQA